MAGRGDAPRDGTMTGRIAAEIEAWARNKPRWTPVPADGEIAEHLDFMASGSTFLAARRLLADRGVLVREGRGCYVA